MMQFANHLNYMISRMFSNGLPAAASLILVTSAIGGCVHSKHAYLADGHPGYWVSCKGLTHSWANCLVKAGRVCGAKGFAVGYSDEIERQLLIECRAAAP